jgi:aspartyl-tRNA(Asn)/glutamyl-tRNA(Gln) amidotransferase subunit A
LQGLPVSLKDLFAAAGYPCYAGSSRRLPADPWERDGPLVATVRRQLGVIMGKTHMVEFAFGGTGQNSHHGAPYNPWDAAAHRSVGGSSSGAGVSLLEGSALLALGSDTAGSVRIPASMTGNAGLKVQSGAGPPQASCRCLLRSTRPGCWRAASPTLPTALPRSIPPASIHSSWSLGEARAI